MARTRNALKRQKVATVESALFNPDVFFLLAGLLDARDLCQVSLTCKTLGGRQADYNVGLSLVEEAARRLWECASEWERSCLPKHEGGGWIELYSHLLMLRSKLTFDQLVGSNIQYGEDQSIAQNSPGFLMNSSALCSNHVMRAGRHFSVSTLAGIARIGVIRPVHVNRSDFVEGALVNFHPGSSSYWEYLRAKRTDRWGTSNVHGCALFTHGTFWWYDWTNRLPTNRLP